MTQHKPLLLITGGSGYIGSALVKEALAAGYQLHILDSMALPEEPFIAAALQNGTAKLISGSITEPDVVRESLQGVEHVIHLAGVSDGRAGKADPELTRKVNSDSMELLLEEAKAAGVRRFVFASTMGVYGNQYRVPLTEELAMAPVDPYSQSKASGEQLVRAAASRSFCTVALRIAMVYGAGVKIREDFLVNKMCQLACTYAELSIMGGAQRRPQIHINDLTGLFLSLLTKEDQDLCGQVFNAVESNPSIEEIAGAICSVLPETRLEKTPGRSDEDSFEMDNKKMTGMLGFQPAISLRSGVEQTIRHFQHKA